MPRPIWRGAISFGMVAIPVRLFTATESKDVSFRQLHREDSRVKQLRWNPNLDREVPYDEIVRGYEYAKDRYVVLDNDFDKLPAADEADDRDQGVREARGDRPRLLRARLLPGT